MREVKELVPSDMRAKYNKEIRLYLLMAVLQVFYMPIVWFQKKKLFEVGPVEDLVLSNKKWYHPYWFYDCDEFLNDDKGGLTKPKQLSFINCTYGDDNYLRLKGRYGGVPGTIKKASAIRSFFWMAQWLTRNNWWNGKKYRGRHLVETKPIQVGDALINEPEDVNPMKFRNKNIFGKQVTFIRFNHFETFRASRTEELSKRHILRWLFGNKYINQQRGYANDRPIYKNRYFK